MVHRGTPAIDPAEQLGQIRLDGLLYPASVQAIYNPTARFSNRIVVGPAEFDSDEVISVDIAADYSGGGQVMDRQEGSDQGRFWWATLHTRDPRALTLAREVTRHAGGSIEQFLLLGLNWQTTSSANAYPLSDLDGTFYGDFDLQVYAWNETNDEFDATGLMLDDHPVNRPIQFGATGAGTAPVMWVPQGSLGFQTFDGASVAAQDTTVLPVAFAEFDQQLWALGSDGRLSSWDGATWSDLGQLDRRHTPRNLLIKKVADDEYALHAITNYGVWVYNEVQGVFVSTDLSFDVAHPDAGLASGTWAGGGGQPGLADGTGAAGGDLYWHVAMQTYRYTLGSTIAPIGPLRDQGLPTSVRGRAVSSVPEQNGYYVLVAGDTVTVGAAADYAFSDMGWSADPWLVSATSATSALLEWTGIGWHTAWVSDDASAEPSLLTLSGASSATRLWWGYGGHLYTINLPRDFHLPRQGLLAGIDRFRDAGYLETGWFDAQMAGFDKLASHFQVDLERCESGCSVIVKYQTDFAAEDEWTTLGDPLTGAGKRVLSFGFAGVRFQRIRFRLEFASTDATESPLVRATILHFDKLPHSAGSWKVVVELDNANEAEYGRDAATMAEELDLLLTAEAGFTRFTLGRTDYRTRVAGAVARVTTGSDPRGQWEISLIEIVDEDDAPVEESA
jgi:hypothetical protein